jgi:DNA-binding beta-propeller fold protein YncE
MCRQVGNLAIVDSSTDDIYVVNTSGFPQDQFDGGFVASGPTGIAVHPTTGTFWVADTTQDEMFGLNADGFIYDAFSTAVFGASSPVGIAFIPTTGEYAILDSAGLEVFFADASGNLQSQCDISSFSSAYPSGITYIAATDQFAITDRGAEEIFIINSACVVQRRFDIGTFGIDATNAYGIVYLPDEARFFIADVSKRSVISVDLDRPGKIVEQFSTSAALSNAPTGITFVPPSQRFVVVDNSAHEGFAVSRSGLLKARFDTSLFANNPQGITFDTVNQVFAILDTSDREVSFLDLPSLTESVTVCDCDLDHDGDCDMSDYFLFGQQWGQTDCLIP